MNYMFGFRLPVGWGSEKGGVRRGQVFLIYILTDGKDTFREMRKQHSPDC